MTTTKFQVPSIATIQGWLRPLFYFTASKYVLIKDWRLGVILRALQVAIFVYVLVDIFLKASYMTTEVPSGFVTVMPADMNLGDRVGTIESQIKDFYSGELKYCQHPEDYAFSWSGIEHKDFECAFLEPAALITIGESHTFLTTSLMVEKMHSYTKDSNGNCADASFLGEKVKLNETIYNLCEYTESKGYFPIDPEESSISLVHSYRTSSFVKKKGTRPRTIVRSSVNGDRDMIIEANTDVKLKLRELLELAGIDLDLQLDKQVNQPTRDAKQGNDTGAYPFARLSGLTLHVTFNYYSRSLAPGNIRKHIGSSADDVICVVDIIPENKWTVKGSDVHPLLTSPTDHLFLTPSLLSSTEKIETAPKLLTSQTDIQHYGVEVMFSVSGSIGRFEISALINALVAGSVLLAVAQIITTYVAVYALGVSSELYKAFMKETVDWRQEYARYAAQACVAGYVFMKSDINGSMKLDRTEIFETLRKLMGKRKDVEDWQLAALADFLMRQGDKGQSVNKGRFRHDSAENYIDIEEWIDIFTEDKANWPALKRLIEHEYRDTDSQDGVLLKLSKSRTRNLIGIMEEGEGDHVERDGTPTAEICRRESDDIDDIHRPLMPHRSAGAGGQPRSRKSL